MIASEAIETLQAMLLADMDPSDTNYHGMSVDERWAISEGISALKRSPWEDPYKGASVCQRNSS